MSAKLCYVTEEETRLVQKEKKEADAQRST